VLRIANALDVSCRDAESIGLETSRSGQGVWKAKRRSGEAAEVHIAAEIEFEDLFFGGTQLNQVDVASELERVLAPGFGQSVGKFESPLDAVHGGIGFTPEIRETRNVYADLIAAG